MKEKIKLTQEQKQQNSRNLLRILNAKAGAMRKLNLIRRSKRMMK
jgi:hypothetical protein